MNIVTYDDLDPFDVLDLNILCFNFALTPEMVSKIRRLDRRPFPFFALYAVDRGRLLGQVGVFQVPLMTTQGPVEAGAIWAMCTHPAYSRQGIGSALIREAHERMRAAGLPFSTLGTSRHWVAHPFYRRHGYLDLANFASALTHRKSLPNEAGSQLVVRKAIQADLAPANDLFRQAAVGKTGFSRRQNSFMEMMIEVGDILSMDELRMIHLGQDLVGYAAVRKSNDLLVVNNFILLNGFKIVDAAAALLGKAGTPYIRLVTDNHSTYLEDLRMSGFRVTPSTLDVTMIKSLQDEILLDQFHQLFDVGSGRFMMSGFDVT